MAVVCLVLGVWGVYDHQVVIPKRLLAHERGDVATAVRDALEPGADETDARRAEELLREQREAFAERFGGVIPSSASAVNSEDEARALAGRLKDTINTFRADAQDDWLRALATFERALPLAPSPAGSPLDGRALQAWMIADESSQRVASIKRPSTFDRPTQWAFILCLPFAPYMFYVYVALQRESRKYRLDDDGTLHHPKGTWSSEEIADIDMSVWMKKSIAYVVHRDGQRVKLDDYKHKNMHLIIGAIASKYDPRQWDEQARDLTLRKDSGQKDSDRGTDESPEGGDRGSSAASPDSADVEASRHINTSER